MASEYSKIEIVTSNARFEDLNDALSRFGVSGITSVHALGCGVEKGAREYAKDMNVRMEVLPKQITFVVVETEKVDALIEVIKQVLYTGHIGDGKIFVSEVTNVIRVRTGEEGQEALS